MLDEWRMKEDMRVIKWILLSCRYAQQGIELKLRCPREIGGDAELAFKLRHHARFGMRMGRTRVLHRPRAGCLTSSNQCSSGTGFLPLNANADE